MSARRHGGNLGAVEGRRVRRVEVGAAMAAFDRLPRIYRDILNYVAPAPVDAETVEAMLAAKPFFRTLAGARRFAAALAMDGRRIARELYGPDYPIREG